MTPATSTDIGTGPSAPAAEPQPAGCTAAQASSRRRGRAHPRCRGHSGGRARPPVVLLVPAGLAAAVALLPLVYLAVRASERGLDTVLEVLLRDRTVALVLRSLALAGAVTAVCLVLGVSLAGLVIRTRLPGRRMWGVLVALPLAVPSYVAAFAWLSLFPRFGGFLGSTLVLS
ncbi:MAG: iron ABC transporter permease, partial [Actinobacteria bacterium]|nr:iron ABC transporter permease [Actinomycetota bacterium]